MSADTRSRAICKSCTQEFVIGAYHDCPGLSGKESLPIVERLRRSHGHGDMYLEAADTIEELVKVLVKARIVIEGLKPNSAASETIARLLAKIGGQQ